MTKSATYTGAPGRSRAGGPFASQTGEKFRAPVPAGAPPGAPSDEGIGLTATLLYNVTGPWIAQVGREGAPDIYTEPFHQLDLTLAQQLPAGFRLSFKASNILDPEQQLTQGPRVAQRFKRGRDFSLGLSWAL